ncbi:MAG: glycosyltransferase family 2 protein [Thermoflavifilum sp.]|nr:glycosyltransferase family 2 protein [Thermoflavifilum sp.]
MKLSIIIVHHQTPHDLELCLWAAQEAIREIAAEIWVVDNASDGENTRRVSTYFRQVHWIWNTENLGFAKACNQAARQASGKYLLFLNPDAFIDHEGLCLALEFLETHPNVHMLGPWLFNMRGQFLKESRRAFPTPWNSFCKMAGLDHVFPNARLFTGYYGGQLPIDQVQPAEVLCGACLLVRHQAWEVVGGFDEDFFLYGEDIDLCLRMYQKGFQSYFHPKWKVLHMKYRSAGQDVRWHRQHFFQAMKIYAHKHFPYSQWLLFPFIDLFYTLSRFSPKFTQVNSSITLPKPPQGIIFTKAANRNLPFSLPESWKILDIDSLNGNGLEDELPEDKIIVVDPTTYSLRTLNSFLMRIPISFPIAWMAPYSGRLILAK